MRVVNSFCDFGTLDRTGEPSPFAKLLYYPSAIIYHYDGPTIFAQTCLVCDLIPYLVPIYLVWYLAVMAKMVPNPDEPINGGLVFQKGDLEFFHNVITWTYFCIVVPRIVVFLFWTPNKILTQRALLERQMKRVKAKKNKHLSIQDMLSQGCLDRDQDVHLFVRIFCGYEIYSHYNGFWRSVIVKFWMFYIVGYSTFYMFVYYITYTYNLTNKDGNDKKYVMNIIAKDLGLTYMQLIYLITIWSNCLLGVYCGLRFVAITNIPENLNVIHPNTIAEYKPQKFLRELPPMRKEVNKNVNDTSNFTKGSKPSNNTNNSTMNLKGGNSKGPTVPSYTSKGVKPFTKGTKGIKGKGKAPGFTKGVDAPFYDVNNKLVWPNNSTVTSNNDNTANVGPNVANDNVDKKTNSNTAAATDNSNTNMNNDNINSEEYQWNNDYWNNDDYDIDDDANINSQQIQSGTPYSGAVSDNQFNSGMKSQPERFFYYEDEDSNDYNQHNDDEGGSSSSDNDDDSDDDDDDQNELSGLVGKAILANSYRGKSKVKLDLNTIDMGNSDLLLNREMNNNIRRKRTLFRKGINTNRNSSSSNGNNNINLGPGSDYSISPCHSNANSPIRRDNNIGEESEEVKVNWMRKV